jgi:hypothetical protein
MSENNSEESPRPNESLEDQQPLAEQVAGLQLLPQEVAPVRTESTLPIRTILIAVFGWIVPGLGHLFQGRFGRALIAFLAVGAMAYVGLRMRGNVFPPHGDDIFGVLGFLADAGSGIFYLFAHSIQKVGPDVSRAAGDYGTRLIATAGVLNLLFVLDATEISRGRKI